MRYRLSLLVCALLVGSCNPAGSTSRSAEESKRSEASKADLKVDGFKARMAVFVEESRALVKVMQHTLTQKDFERGLGRVVNAHAHVPDAW